MGAEQAAQADLRAQYDKEQELYQNKSLLSKESKDKLEVNFMYEPPPGVKKISANPDDDEGEPEYKFEWQRTWGHAPKESYLADGDSFAEQPFGIQVCQAKCMKCGAFGHMNTPKLVEYGTALMSNLATKEGSAAFDDVCSELAMAILQFFQGKPPEEQVFRCMGALSKFCSISREVPQLVKMIGPEPSKFNGMSPRIDEILGPLNTRLASIPMF